MMYPSSAFRVVRVVLLVSLLFGLFASVALAADTVPGPVPVVGPRLSPPPIPHSSVLNPAWIYNQPRVPQNQEAYDVLAEGSYNPGAGVERVITPISNGITLYKPVESVCYNFNDGAKFASKWQGQNGGTDIWSDYYSGWGPFAVDDYLRQAKNTTFSLERTIGPGAHYGSGYSLKIASNQPYAGGWGSPLISVTPNSEVTVSVNFLIYDWTQDLGDHEIVHDWASMGVKADGANGHATYVNGYTQGRWSTLSQTVTAGPSGQIMILIQGESTGAVNSNIYFDNVIVSVDGENMSCE